MSVKGWCPGALRPMESGDGLLVRVRPSAGILSPPLAAGLADCAERYGNGFLDLTSRANLQLRGVTAQMQDSLQQALQELGILDDDPEVEAVRNILASPLAGIDPTLQIDVLSIVGALEKALRDDAALRALPAKFGFLVDGGGVFPLRPKGATADIAILAAAPGEVRIEAAGILIARCSEADAASLAIALAHDFLSRRRPQDRRMRDLLAHSPIAKMQGTLSETDGGVSVAASRHYVPPYTLAAAPFGSMDARQLHGLAQLAERYRGDLRLTPFRSLLVTCEAATGAVESLGLLTSLDHPLLRVAACSGAPACASAFADTRAIARDIAAILPEALSIHVSGCSKGCARREPAALSVTAEAGGYAIARHARAADPRQSSVFSREALLAYLVSEFSHADA